MRFSTWLYFLRETLLSLKRNTWMAFASASVVAITMLIFGTFLLLVVNLDFMTRNLESDVEISVFLKNSVTADARQSIEKAIAALPGVGDVRFVSKDEGLKSLQKEMQWDESDLEVVGANPLPDAFYVRAKKPEAVDSIAQAITKLPGVDQVRYGKDVVTKLFSLTRAIRYAGLFIIIALAVAAVFIISNTIKLTVFGRRKEIFIMKSVGATNWFIRWPFVLEGMILGLIGGGVATGVLYWFYGYLVQKVSLTLPFITMVKDPQFLSQDYWAIVLLGAVLGILGSGISLRRFLKI